MPAHRGPAASHRRFNASQDSLTTDDTSIADTPASTSSSSFRRGAVSSLSAFGTRAGSVAEAGTPPHQRRQQRPETGEEAGQAWRRRGAALLAPPLADLCGEGGGEVAEAAAETCGGSSSRGGRKTAHGGSDASSQHRSGRPKSGQAPVSAPAAPPPSSSFSSSAKHADARVTVAAADKGASTGPDRDNSGRRDFSRRASEYRKEHGLSLDLANAQPSSTVLRFQAALPGARATDGTHGSPLSRGTVSPRIGGGALPPLTQLPPRAASPRMWPFISPGNSMPLAVFTPTLNHVPARLGGHSPFGSPRGTRVAGATVPEVATAGSVVAAIRTRAEEVHPGSAEMARRRAEGRLPYPSRMTFGYSDTGAGDGGCGSAGTSLQSGSLALRAVEASVGRSARGPPVMRAVETEVPVERRFGLPVRCGLRARRQRQQDRAERAAESRERTHATLLRSHHVPLVPFTTYAEERDMPLPAPTVEEAITGFEYDEEGYYRADTNGVIEAPHKLQRAMMRASVPPTTPALNAGSVGFGSVKKRRPAGDAFVTGATKYLFGRRAGGGPRGGGRSAFLNEADPSQVWAAQLSAQTRLHLDPLFPEELMIDDLADDDDDANPLGRVMTPPHFSSSGLGSGLGFGFGDSGLNTLPTSVNQNSLRTLLGQSGHHLHGNNAFT